MLVTTKTDIKHDGLTVSLDGNARICTVSQNSGVLETLTTSAVQVQCAAFANQTSKYKNMLKLFIKYHSYYFWHVHCIAVCLSPSNQFDQKNVGQWWFGLFSRWRC